MLDIWHEQTNKDRAEIIAKVVEKHHLKELEKLNSKKK